MGGTGAWWSSPVGAGLYVSVVLRPHANITCLVTIPAAGVAIAEGIQAASGLDASVKWPNDLYAGGRKLAGILAEAESPESGIPYVVLGFGVNVRPAAFPPDAASRATSIEGELGRPIYCDLLLASCLASLASRYADLQDGRAAAVLEAWRLRAASTFRRPVGWIGRVAGARGGGEYRRGRCVARSRWGRRRAGDFGGGPVDLDNSQLPTANSQLDGNVAEYAGRSSRTSVARTTAT